MSRATPGIIIDVICYGDPGNWRSLVLLKSHINENFKEACPMQTVRIAYNNVEKVFQVDRDENIVMYPYPASLSDMRPGEILSSFLVSQNLVPEWTNCNGSWGTFHNGSWTGAVAEVHILSKS